VQSGVPVVRAGNRITNEELALDLRLDGDRLTGHYPGPRSEASFHRVDALSAEPPVPDLPSGPEPKWQTRLGGTVYASPVVANGIAYIGTTGGVLNAVDTRDGKSVWTFSAGVPLYGAGAIDGDALYLIGDDGTLFRLQRSNGKLVWKASLQTSPVARVLPHPSVFDWDWQGPQPLVADGVVYVGTGDGVFHAVDAETGKPRWHFATSGRIRNGAALSADRVLVGSADHFVYALDAANGSELWCADTRAEVDTTPVVHEGKVLVGNRGAGLSAFDAETGKELWRTSSGDRGWNPRRWCTRARSTSVPPTCAASAPSTRRTETCCGAATCSAGPGAPRWWTATDCTWASPAAHRISSATWPATSPWIARAAAC
jgi:outer membrane protein assembly factor BamB